MSLTSNGQGSDCRCKCVIHEENRQQCPDEINFSIIYSVEAISTGTDCQCSCQDPPSAKECPKSSKKVTKSAKTLERLDSILNDFERVRTGMDFTKIHNTVEHMILAMVEMEKSFGGSMMDSYEDFNFSTSVRVTISKLDIL